MFKSSFISSSIPIFKSSAIASYGEIVGKNDISEIQLEEKILYFDKYRISCQEDDSAEDILANIGIGILNIFGAFTDTKIPFPDHWFLIARTKNNNYYLIQKGEGGKSIAYFDDKDKAKECVKENYHDNKIIYMGRYKLLEKINIKDIIKYVETLSNSYNLIDDNCQVFVKNILKHYNLEKI